ncbi:MAG TPA: TolC family protein [Capsulimonadaceae bacterium]|nr:TolC family protein [Capsulimonadaceae bacterium]
MNKLLTQRYNQVISAKAILPRACGIVAAALVVMVGIVARHAQAQPAATPASGGPSTGASKAPARHKPAPQSPTSVAQTIPSSPAGPKVPSTPAPPVIPAPLGSPQPTLPPLAGTPTVPMPTVTVPTLVTGLPTTPAAPPMTLDQVIARVLSTNPTILLSQQRLKLAQAAIQQGEASGFPQVRISAADTYSGVATLGGPGSVAVQNPTAPGGSGIQTIVDAAQGQTFTGGGGTLGTTTTQAISSSGGTGSSSTASNGATITPVSPSNPTATPGGTTTTPGVGTTGGTGSPPIAGGGGSGGGATPQVAKPSNSQLPSDPILQQYAALAASQDPSNQNTPVLAPNATGSNGKNNNAPTSHNAYGGNISLSQLVDVFGLVPAAVGVLKESAQFFEIDLDREMNEEALTTKNTFYEIVRAQNDVATAQEQVTNAQATVTDAQQRFNAGVAPEFDVISAQTQLSSAQAQLLNAQNTLNTQKANLGDLMGLPAGTDFILTAPDMPALANSYTEPDEIGKAYGSRPEMRQAKLDEDISDKLVKLAYGQKLPTLAIGGNVDYTNNAIAGSSHYSESVTAQISMPLYDGGLANSEIRQAKIDQQTTKITETQLRQNIALEVEAALINLQNASALVQADEANVTASRESLALAQVRYRAGVGTLLDVTNAQAQLAASEENLSAAEFQLQTANAALVRAEGGR